MDDPATPEPVIPSSAPPSEIDAAAVRRVWDEILTMVGQKSKKVAAWAREATVRDIDGKTLVLTFRHSFHARALSEQPELISEAANEVLGSRWQIRCELAGDQRPIRRPRHRPAGRARRPTAVQARAAQRRRPRRRRKPPRPVAPMTGRSPPRWADRRHRRRRPTQPPPANGRRRHRRPRPPVIRVPRPGRPPRARRPAAPAADAEWAGEPPYDPEYDGPAQAAAPPEDAAQSVPYEGFDPGDEPTDEVIDEKTARQTSEQQAFQLLQRALGAERIGEVELK